MIRSIALLLLFCVGLLGMPTPSYAIPIQLVMVTDKLKRGRAIFTGDYDTLGNGIQVHIAKTTTGADPIHWSLNIVTSKFSNDAHPKGFNLISFEGKHISKPPPHSGELSPGPLLALGSVGLPLFTVIIDDFAGELVRRVPVMHDNPHHIDVMETTLVDLNPGNAKSVTAGLANEFRAVINFWHVPEPSILPLFAAGLSGLFFVGRGRKDARI